MRINIRHFETIFWSPCLIARVASVKVTVAGQMSLAVGGTFSTRSLWPLCVLLFWPIRVWWPLSGDCFQSFLYNIPTLFAFYFILFIFGHWSWHNDSFLILTTFPFLSQLEHWWIISISGKSVHEDNRVWVDVSGLLAVQLLGFQLCGGAEASCISITCALTAGPLGTMLHNGPEPLISLGGEGKQGRASADWVTTLGCFVGYRY